MCKSRCCHSPIIITFYVASRIKHIDLPPHSNGQCIPSFPLVGRSGLEKKSFCGSLRTKHHSRTSVKLEKMIKRYSPTRPPSYHSLVVWTYLWNSLRTEVVKCVVDGLYVTCHHYPCYYDGVRAKSSSQQTNVDLLDTTVISISLKEKHEQNS